MTIKYGCFVSYCHGQTKGTRDFLAAFREDLESSLEGMVTLPGGNKDLVYFDEARLKPGYQYNDALAEAICQSLCLVAVLVPSYFEHPYCCRELEAMHVVEGRRRQLLGAAIPRHHGYVIPIVYKGNSEDLPAGLKGSRHYCDLSGAYTVSNAHGRRAQRQHLRNVADHVRDVYKSLRGQAATIDCGQFMLPSEDDARPWMTAMPVFEPQPLRSPR